MARKILIVDDESDIATYLATVLRASGFFPTVALNAQSALAMVHETHPDLISLDIMMPKESGITMYIQLKKDQETGDIPVIIVSGVTQEGGFDFRSYVPDESVAEPESFMEKPIDVDEYVKIIKQLTSSKRSTRRQKTK